MEDKLRQINQLIAFGLTLWMLWILIPSHTRRRILMGAAETVRRAAAAAARHTGAAGMQLELDGRPGAADGQYRMAYTLMTRVHDRAAAWYRGATDVTG